ncbi:MAG: hypothetical protein NVSMB38_01270 [Ktedonobacteraceae bacterium]
MQATTVPKQQRSLVGGLRNGLIAPISLLLLGLILGISAGIFASISQYNLGEQKVALQENLDGMLRSMINQETGIRGYISTNNTIFLDPFNSGRPQYSTYLKQLQSSTNNASFSNTSALILTADNRASDWYNNYALAQIKNMETGDLTTARSDRTNTEGKVAFDAFRSAMGQLQGVVNSDLTNLQFQVNAINTSAIIFAVILSIVAVVILWRAFGGLIDNLGDQLAIVQTTTTQLGSGNLAARVPDLPYVELGQLGRTFNSMAATLQDQQAALQERDIMESVQQLNSILTKSLDLESLTKEFVRTILSLLNIQLGVLYLYDHPTRQLTMFASQGVDSQHVQSEFRLGEGLVGQVAQSRKTLYLSHRNNSTKEPFSVKTALGNVLPAGLYHLPLADGKDLLGVLVVGSVYPMNENARNVLDVVASNLTAALSNTQAYRHIQEQAEELEKRSHEQEAANIALRNQRDDLTVLNAALEDANKARSQFLSTMSHELRTPLTSILGFSQILLRSGDSANFNQRQKSNIERILKNGQHLLTLINDVLDLAKIEAGRMDVNNSEVDLHELLSAVVEETRSIAIDRRLVLQWHVEEGMGSLETDPIKLRQILLNLISNALKFTEKGSVTVTARRVTPLITTRSDPEGLISEYRGDDEQIAIAVQDTGIGISQEMQERIFEAFYQVDGSNTRKYGGTGLGLSIVRQLIILLGGKLELQSIIDQGSTFTLYLPARARALRTEQQDTRLNGGALALQGSSSTINALETLSGEDEQEQHLVLAIDDNPDVLSLINNALENSPYKMIGVNDSSKAVEMAQKLQPIAVTLDVMMPEVNGWQILHQLRSNPATATIPVIMLTVLEDRSAAHVLGADEYLVKPVERETLLDTLRHVAAQHTLAPITVSSIHAAQTETTNGPSEMTTTQQQPFLVLNIERSAQAMLERILSEAGLTVKTASNEQEMLDIIQHSKPDVIVLRVIPDAAKEQ